MTPSENIYQSDVDMVDGLDPVIEQMEEYIAHGNVFQDEMDAATLAGLAGLTTAYDDGQPTLQEEYHDLYSGDDYIGDMYMDTIDYPEDWG